MGIVPKSHVAQIHDTNAGVLGQQDQTQSTVAN
jgi:hypothetical protein